MIFWLIRSLTHYTGDKRCSALCSPLPVNAYKISSHELFPFPFCLLANFSRTTTGWNKHSLLIISRQLLRFLIWTWPQLWPPPAWFGRRSEDSFSTWLWGWETCNYFSWADFDNLKARTKTWTPIPNVGPEFEDPSWGTHQCCLKLETTNPAMFFDDNFPITMTNKT